MNAISLDPWPVFALIKDRRWYAQKHRAADAVTIIDAADFTATTGARCRWLMLAVAPGDQIYSLTIEIAPGGAMTLVSPHLLLDRLMRDPLIATRRGGVLRFDGPSGATESLPATYRLLDLGDSSNTVFETRFAGRRCAAKFFRKMDGNARREVDTLRALDALTVTPRLFAQIVHEHTGDENPPQVIASFMEYIAGEPAYRPFQAAARSTLNAVLARVPLPTLLARETSVRRDICEAIGQGVAHFHTSAQRCGSTDPARRLSSSEHAHVLGARWRALLPLLHASTDLDGLVTPAALDRLTTFFAALPDQARRAATDLRPSYGHGDLHLSHIILGGPAGGCRIIDPANSVREPKCWHHGAADLFQLYRGLENFAFDEAATRLQQDAGISRESAGRLLAAPADDRQDDRIGCLMTFVRDWPTTVFEAILDAYRANADAELSEPLRDPRWCAIFYLSRLLHEADYNIRYNRLFFRLCDWAFLTLAAKRLDSG